MEGGEADFRLWFGTLQGLTVLPWRSSWRTSVPREYNTFKHKTLVGTKALREENSPQRKVTMENETPLLFKAQYGGCAAESRHRGRPGCSTLCVGLLPTLGINSPDFFQPDHVYFCYSIILGKKWVFFPYCQIERKTRAHQKHETWCWVYSSALECCLAPSRSYA